MPKMYMFVIVIIFILSTVGIFITTRSLLSSPPKTNGEEKPVEVAQNPEVLGALSSRYAWWDTNFSYFSQITLENNDQSREISQDTWIKVPFDHKELLDKNKALWDGTDLRVIYLNGSEYQVLSFELFSPNTTSAELWFKTKTPIATSSQDDNYFIYYGHKGANDNPTMKKGEGLLKFHTENFQSYVSTEARSPVFGKTNRTWILRGNTLSQKISTLNYSVTLADTLKQPKKISYEILDTNVKGTLKKKEGVWSINNINIDVLPVGEYQIQASYTLEGETFTSQKSTFHISHPLYVALTLDWEGTDVTDAELASVANFSAQYDTPYSHYVSPRIYLETVVNKDRAAYLTNWLKDRELEGDHIALHLHMNFDMVAAMGIEVKKEPQWTNYIKDGHDVPTTVYSYEELKVMFEWSKQQFIQNGLQSPTAFRAGGWFADEDTLRALNDTGFIIDTSGREYYIWGQNKLKGDWTLLSTTQPYRPSISNQNAPTPGPQLNLWEFPNNGADFDYYEPNVLIDKFNSNYTSQHLSSTKVVTFLSHPHGYPNRIHKIEKVYDYIDKLNALSDNGPVIYESHDIIYNEITSQ